MTLVGKIKLVIFPLCFFPLTELIVRAVQNQLGPDPAAEMTHELGKWALIFLLASLAITPLRQLTGINKLIQFRRMIGLFSLFYAALHLMSYLAFMLAWQWQVLLEDLYKRSYIIVGAVALLILLLLGLTSTRGMMRKLGKRWSKLHKLVYVAGLLAVVHYLWLVKSDYTEPLMYGSVLLLLLAFRFKRIRRLFRT